MNKLRGTIALIMGINAGMRIISNIWSSSAERIPLAILYVVMAVVCILQMKEPVKRQKER